MHFINALTIVAPFMASLATAAPAAPASTAAPQTFHLKSTSSDSRFNGLYVAAYHTGAGTADATFVNGTADAAPFYLNGTAVDSTVYGSASPAGLQLPGNTMYDEFYPVTVNAGYGTPGLKFGGNGAGLVSSGSGEEFYGWLACLWAHGVPQLFYLADSSSAIPSNCAMAKIVKA